MQQPRATAKPAKIKHLQTSNPASITKAMHWDPEWLEVCWVHSLNRGMVADGRLHQFANSMGEAPQLPETMDEKKTKAVNDIMLMAASHLPPPPKGISSCKLWPLFTSSKRAYSEQTTHMCPVAQKCGYTNLLQVCSNLCLSFSSSMVVAGLQAISRQKIGRVV